MSHIPKDFTRAWIHLTTYACLLVATPFLMLRNYLQPAIGRLSRATIALSSMEIPLIPLVALPLGLFALWLVWKRWGKRALLLTGFVLAAWLSAQQVADYYFNHHWYELQHNWHYLAYLLYSLLYWRASESLGLATGKRFAAGLALALLISFGDELIQIYISSRVFDVSDIAKDVWGAATGLSVIQLNGHLTAQDEGKSPAGLPRLIARAMLPAWIFLCCTSWISDPALASTALGIGFLFALLALLLIEVLRRLRPVLSFGLTGLLAAGLIALFIGGADSPTVFKRDGLVMYHGLPLAGFDYLVHPDGRFRPVDKKHAFNTRDFSRLLDLGEDILLLGTGSQGKGGIGLPEDAKVQFVKHAREERGIQVIALPTPLACQVFDRLKEEGMATAFVIHTGD
jgi:VanZ family protein